MAAKFVLQKTMEAVFKGTLKKVFLKEQHLFSAENTT